MLRREAERTHAGRVRTCLLLLLLLLLLVLLVVLLLLSLSKESIERAPSSSSS